MSLLATATAWLVEPVDKAPSATGLVALAPPPAAGAAALSRLAVLGPPAAVPALAAAVALACRARAGVPSAIVALWPSAGDDCSPRRPHGPVLPGAAALAARLSRRGLPVTATGRLAWLLLAPTADDAVPMLRHAEAAAGELPVVLAVARPRDAAVDSVLAERELLVVAAMPSSPLARVAEADAVALRVAVRPCAPLPPGGLRLAALAGLRAPRLDLWAEPALPAVRRLPGPMPGEEAW
jgi:hypothetical protein